MKEMRSQIMTLEVLLVENSPGDVRLTQEAFRDAGIRINLHVAVDGVAAMAFLRDSGEITSDPPVLALSCWI